MHILHLDAGITPNSVSRQVSRAVIDALRHSGQPLDIVYRDLDADPIPHLGGTGLATLGQHAALDEFLAADVVVIGAPMYNFGIPSTLKAWFDQILVAGKTFRYTENGPEGLAGGKTVIVASARGGFYGEGTPLEALDFQEKYLRTVFGFIGVTDVTFVRAEGVAIGPEQREAALAAALKAAAEVSAPAPALAA
jgi:FMN-dependent NADH-azoreductase